MMEIKIKYYLKDGTTQIIPLWRIEEGLQDRFNDNDIKARAMYIGHKDKNLKEIYEGDILKLDNGFEEDLCNMIVEIKNGIVGVRNILDFGDIDDDIFVLGNIDNNGRILDTNLEDYEIIGNIYENPELLTNK